jgi:Ca-activated chloride channel family protein
MKYALAVGSLALLMLASCSYLEGQAAAVSPSPTPAAHDGASRLQAPGPPLKVEVDLVQVETSVRDEHGRAVDNLKRQDFRVFEDGVEQRIRYFSQDELPLAVALVIDGSTSVAAALDDLRAGALDTLSLLKPDDEVALYSFTERPQQREGLTTDRNAIVEGIAEINPGGGTNINDALHAAAVYLGQQASDRRRAIILVSDNVASDRGSYDEQQVVRAALDNETVIYSIKVGFWDYSRLHYLMHPDPYLGWVNRICRETGGELIDSRTAGSVTSALATVLAQLKAGYTLGYSSSNRLKDGTFRTIEVRLVMHSQHSRHKYTVYGRRGYYAPGKRDAQSPVP